MDQDSQSGNPQQPSQPVPPTTEKTVVQPTYSNETTPQDTASMPKLTRRKKLLIMSLAILVLGFLGYFFYQKLTVEKPESVSKPSSITPNTPNTTNNQPNQIVDDFCGEFEYCSMNENCESLPENHGFYESEEVRDKYNLCGTGDELLNKFVFETLFYEDIEKLNEKTKIGYLLIKNTDEGSKKNVASSFECLNYDGLCQDINVTYPTSFQIEANDVIIFPIYIEKNKNITGLVSLEFTFEIAEKSSMIGVDVIFNEDKICIYQWGLLDRTRSFYFNGPSNVDWTQECQ